MATICYLIKKNGEYGSCDERELKCQVENYGAEFIGTFKQLSQAEIKHRYPRLIKLYEQNGYNTVDECVYYLWQYLRFRNVRWIDRHTYLLAWHELFQRRHELKRIFG